MNMNMYKYSYKSNLYINAMDAINHLTSTTTNKNDILDPLSIIVKLFIILKYKY